MDKENTLEFGGSCSLRALSKTSPVITIGFRTSSLTILLLRRDTVDHVSSAFSIKTDPSLRPL